MKLGKKLKKVGKSKFLRKVGEGAKDAGKGIGKGAASIGKATGGVIKGAGQNINNLTSTLTNPIFLIAAGGVALIILLK